MPLYDSLVLFPQRQHGRGARVVGGGWGDRPIQYDRGHHPPRLRTHQRAVSALELPCLPPSHAQTDRWATCPHGAGGGRRASQGACTGFARPGTARSIACDDRAPPRHCYTARMHPRHEVLPRPCASAAGAQLRPREEGQQARRTSARSSMPSTPPCWPIRDQADVLGRREGAWTGFMGAHPVLLRNAGFAPEYERHECQIHKITTAVVTVPYYAIPVAFTAPCALQPRQSSHWPKNDKSTSQPVVF